jgi:hypothetical protein
MLDTSTGLKCIVDYFDLFGSCSDGDCCEGGCVDDVCTKPCPPACPDELVCRLPADASDATAFCLPPAAHGSYCGPGPHCEDVFGAGSPAAPNATSAQCAHAQCASGFCSQVAAPELLPSYPVCTRDCRMVEDEFDNRTGAPDPDGIEDPPYLLFSDCRNPPGSTRWANGPASLPFMCVGLAPPGTTVEGVCLPGTTFRSCERDADCPDEEGCFPTTIGGTLNRRCLARIQAGPWGGGAAPGAPCNDNDATQPLVFCASGICRTSGCASFCVADADCDGQWICGSEAPVYPELTGFQARLCEPAP